METIVTVILTAASNIVSTVTTVTTTRKKKGNKNNDYQIHNAYGITGSRKGSVFIWIRGDN